MSDYRAKVRWTRSTPDFAYDTYDRGHTVTFESGIAVPASSAPEYKGDAAKVNPEEQLVGALSSCHMLTFLAICARKKLTVDSYEDDASGIMTKNDRGKAFVSAVTLRPKVTFARAAPSAEDLDALHHAAHENCFIANSVQTIVTVKAR